MKDVLFYQNYTPVADVCTLAIGMVYWFLLRSTYTMKQKNLTMFKLSNILVMLAAASNIAFHQMIPELSLGTVIPLYILRNLMYLSIMTVCAVFSYYISNLVDVMEKQKKLLSAAIWGALLFFCVFEVLTPVTRLGFYIDGNLQIHQNYYLDIFRFCYMYYLCYIVLLLVVNRRKFITKMYQCVCSVLAISFFTMVLQAAFLSTSYICITFTFPMMSILFLFHHNSYDIKTGTLDARAFDAYVRDLKGDPFTVIQLQLYNVNREKMAAMSQEFFHFNEKFFKNPCTFRFGSSQFVMVFKDAQNPDREKKFPKLWEDFHRLYEKYHIDYRIVQVHSRENAAMDGEYIALCDFLMRRMPLNTIYCCRQQDVSDFFEEKYLLRELQDIAQKRDLDDARVKAYCQPVLDTVTGKFSSAEALMRLELPGHGMVYPDQFIPLAEQNEYIHALSMIILNKTCQNIKNMEEQGYRIDRISVNFSIIELKDQKFCDDIIQVIHENGIPYEKIAIELTESRNEKDYVAMQYVMEKLQTLGVKFYLDDFGTGYSNFERIIGLPIDIIKFDRSLTLLAGQSEESRFMVGSFSDIFKRSNYQILFEGVEDENAEMYCRQMNAQYLQGYRYSKPIPMEQLVEFAEKTV